MQESDGFISVRLAVSDAHQAARALDDAGRMLMDRWLESVGGPRRYSGAQGLVLCSVALQLRIAIAKCSNG